MVQNHVSDIYLASMPNNKITFAHLEVKNSPKISYSVLNMSIKSEFNYQPANNKYNITKITIYSQK